MAMTYVDDRDHGGAEWWCGIRRDHGGLTVSMISDVVTRNGVKRKVIHEKFMNRVLLRGTDLH